MTGAAGGAARPRRRPWAALLLLPAFAGCRTPVPWTRVEFEERRRATVQATPKTARVLVDGESRGEPPVELELVTNVRMRRYWRSPFDAILAIPWAAVLAVDYVLGQGSHTSFRSLDELARGVPKETREPVLHSVEVQALGHKTLRRRVGADTEERAFLFDLEPIIPGMPLPPPLP